MPHLGSSWRETHFVFLSPRAQGCSMFSDDHSVLWPLHIVPQRTACRRERFLALKDWLMVSMSTLGRLDCALPPKVAVALKARSDELRMIPEAANKALTMIRNAECDIGKFAGIIEKDVKLAADILRLANGPFYGLGRPVGDVREAVVQVGFQQCKNLIQASCASSLMQKLDGAAEQARNALWQHSLVTGQASVLLTKRLGLQFGGEEFTAGLMHDLGRLLLAVVEPDRFAELDPVDFLEATDPTGPERSLIETDHCAVGSWFSATNGLPDDISAAIRFHHQPGQATIASELVAVVAAADDIANHVARGESASSYDVETNLGIQILIELGHCEQGKAVEIATEVFSGLLEQALA